MPDPFELPRTTILPWDVASLADREKELLELTDGVAALWPVGQWSPAARPVILVHGINADFQDLQPVVTHYHNRSDRQVMVLAYRDQQADIYESGLEFAVDLMRFRLQYATWGTTNIVAHSMGGLVSRWALNELTGGAPGGIGTFSRINFLAMDSPWHGFWGPGVFPGGGPKQDLQARSRMFNGWAGGPTATRRAGLFKMGLPGNVRVQICSANNQAAGEEPDDILDFTDIDEDQSFNLHGLTEAIKTYLEDGAIEPVGPLSSFKKIYIHHYLSALSTDTDWPTAESELRTFWQNGQLGPDKMMAVLGKNMKRYTGGHSSVLASSVFLHTLDHILDD